MTGKIRTVRVRNEVVIARMSFGTQHALVQAASMNAAWTTEPHF